MLTKKKKSNLKKQLIAIAIFLLILQIGLLVYYKYFNATALPKNAIESAVDKTPGVTKERKPILMTQMALVQYQSKNKGKLPTSLDQLVPNYLSAVPKGLDGKPLKYVVDGSGYKLGDDAVNTILNKNSSKNNDEFNISDTEKEALIHSLDEISNSSRPIYDPSDKRDPFKPIDLAPNESKRRELTPLENYSLDKLSYSAFIRTDAEPKAILENNEGRGFTVTKGTKVGPNQGEILEITPDKITVVESLTDIKGNTTVRTYDFVLGAKGYKSIKR